MSKKIGKKVVRNKKVVRKIKKHPLPTLKMFSDWPMVVIGAVVVGVMALVGARTGILGGEVLGSSNISAEGLLAVTNYERGLNGLGGLALNDRLNQAALNKAEDMFERQYWAHDAPDGGEPWRFVEAVGYKYGAAAENLARGFSTPQAVVAAWMRSEPHRVNLLNGDYTEVGFGVARGSMGGQMTTLIVAFYATPATAGVAPQNMMVVPDTANATGESFWTALARGFYVASPLMLALVLVLFVFVVCAIVSGAKAAKSGEKPEKRKQIGMMTAKVAVIVVAGAIVIVSYGGVI